MDNDDNSTKVNSNISQVKNNSFIEIYQTIDKCDNTLQKCISKEK